MRCVVRGTAAGDIAAACEPALEVTEVICLDAVETKYYSVHELAAVSLIQAVSLGQAVSLRHAVYLRHTVSLRHVSLGHVVSLRDDM